MRTGFSSFCRADYVPCALCNEQRRGEKGSLTPKSASTFSYTENKGFMLDRSKSTILQFEALVKLLFFLIRLYISLKPVFTAGVSVTGIGVHQTTQVPVSGKRELPKYGRMTKKVVVQFGNRIDDVIRARFY